jgi:hypothetical protein
MREKGIVADGNVWEWQVLGFIAAGLSGLTFFGKIVCGSLFVLSHQAISSVIFFVAMDTSA